MQCWPISFTSSISVSGFSKFTTHRKRRLVESLRLKNSSSDLEKADVWRIGKTKQRSGSSIWSIPSISSGWSTPRTEKSWDWQHSRILKSNKSSYLGASTSTKTAHQFICCPRLQLKFHVTNLHLVQSKTKNSTKSNSTAIDCIHATGTPRNLPKIRAVPTPAAIPADHCSHKAFRQQNETMLIHSYIVQFVWFLLVPPPTLVSTIK